MKPRLSFNANMRQTCDDKRAVKTSLIKSMPRHHTNKYTKHNEFV